MVPLMTPLMTPLWLLDGSPLRCRYNATTQSLTFHDFPRPSTPPTRYNEVTQSSQWQHPVDEIAKAFLLALRSPTRATSAAVVETHLGPKALLPPKASPSMTFNS